MPARSSRRAAHAALMFGRQRDPPRKGKLSRRAGRVSQRPRFNRLEGHQHAISAAHHPGEADLPWCSSMATPRCLFAARGGLVHVRRLPGAGHRARATSSLARRAMPRSRPTPDGAVLPGAVRLVLKIALSQTAIVQLPYTPVFIWGGREATGGDRAAAGYCLIRTISTSCPICAACWWRWSRPRCCS